MVIPKLCNWANLNALKCIDVGSPEAIKIRVLMPGRPTTTPVRLAGKKRTYVFEYSTALHCHVLEVPLTVWIEKIGTATPVVGTPASLGVPIGPFKPHNTSICADINRLNNGQLVVTAMPMPTTNTRP